MRKRSSQQIQESSQQSIKTQLAPSIKFKTSDNTPRLFLPKLPTYFQGTCSPGMESIDNLESYLHKMLFQEHSCNYQLKKRQKKREHFERRKEHAVKKDEIDKENRKRQHIYQLHQKLKELMGQLEVEQKKLDIQYRLRNQMSKQYENVYDAMNWRLHYTDKRDQIAQTTEVEIDVREEPAKVEEEKKEKKPEGYYRRKFRVAAYSVYFALAFPKYVQICRQLRRKHFKEQVVGKNALMGPVDDYFKILVGLKLSEIHRNKERAKRHSKQEPIALDFEQADATGDLRKYSISLTVVSELVFHILTNIKDKLQKGELGNLLKMMSRYLLDRSFIADRIYLPDELYRLKIDNNSQLRLTKQYEKQLLLNFLISKLTCFKFLTENKNSGKLLVRRNSKLKESNSKQVTKVLLLSGLYLFKKANEANFNVKVEEEVKKKGNAELLGQRVPLPLDDFELKEDLDVFGIESSGKRISIEGLITFSILNIPGLKYHKMDKCQDLVKVICQNSRYEAQISSLLLQIRDLMHSSCQEYKISHLKQIKESTLNYKHYLTVPIEVGEEKVSRLPKEQKNIDKWVELMTEARKEVRPQHQIYKFTSTKIVSQKDNAPQSANSNNLRSGSNISSNKNSQSNKSIIRHRQTKSGEISVSHQSKDTLQNIPVVGLSQNQRAFLKKQSRDSNLSIKQLKNSNKM